MAREESYRSTIDTGVEAALSGVDMNMLYQIQKQGVGSLTTPGLSDVSSKLFLVSPSKEDPCRPHLSVASRYILKRLTEVFATEFDEFADVIIKLYKDVTPMTPTRKALHEPLCPPVFNETVT